MKLAASPATSLTCRICVLSLYIVACDALSSGRYRNPTVKPAWYKQRQRNVTPAQKRAERALWPTFGLTFAHDRQLDLDAAFGRTTARRVMEIGCGSGEALTVLAAERPECDFLGCDWLRRGLASCLTTLDERELSNVRLVRADAATLIATALPERPLFDEVLFFFPDPWYGSPERRIVRPDVLDSLSLRMRPGGVLRVGTDVHGYPEQIRATVAAAAGGAWEPASCEAMELAGSCCRRPSTKYEREGIEEGRTVEDLCFVFRSGE